MAIRGPNKGPNKTSPKTIAARERQLKALELRKAGYTLQQIADNLDYTPSGAAKAVKSILARTEQESADEFRVLEVLRLDHMLTGLWQKAIKGDTWSVDRVLKIMERRAALLGLDAPAKREVSGPDGGAIMLLDYRGIAERTAADLGLDVEEVLAEAERYLTEQAGAKP